MTTKFTSLIFALMSLTVIAQKEVQLPVAKKVPLKSEIHGEERIDNYAWIRNKDKDPDVMKYLKAESAYTEAIMKPTKKFQTALYKEILSRIKETDMGVPYKWKGYWYYTRTEKGKNHPFNCRKKGSMENDEELLLDCNELVKSHKAYSINGHIISPGNMLMAYMVDKTGNFENDIYFKNLENGEMLPDTLKAVTSIDWCNDNKTLYYSIQDPVTNRSNKIMKHVLGTDPKKDELIYEETDKLFNVYVTKSKSEQFIFMICDAESANKNEWRYLDADKPDSEFSTVHQREDNHLYEVSHYADKFYIKTDKGAPNFRLMEAPVSDPSIANWKEVIPHRDDVMIEDVDIFKDYLVLTENDRCTYKIRIKRWDGNGEHYLPFEEETYMVYTHTNLEFDTKLLRYGYTSFITPGSVFEYNMETKEKTLLKQREVPGGYDQTKYESKRLWATAADGTKVPISLFYKKGLKLDGNNPTLIYAYGSYGSSSYPYFGSSRFNYIDRGFVYATAHVRGGKDMGKHWYEDGKMLNKRNTFTDFIACAEHLIKEGYTSKGLITANGGSAGGLLMGAIVNMRPDLWKGVQLDVPFVDVINTMLDSTIPLTTEEYKEWGNPNIKKDYDYMKTYSPYDNVEAKDYPPMLFISGIADEQVGYWEPTKMVAKLRDMKTDDNIVLLKIILDGGHGGKSGRYDYYKDLAFEHAWMLGLYGITK